MKFLLSLYNYGQTIYKLCRLYTTFLTIKSIYIAKRTWNYLFNTFKKNTRHTNIKMLSIATDTYAKLQAQSHIATVATILSCYEPVFGAYKNIYVQYDVVADSKKGGTFQFKILLDE